MIKRVVGLNVFRYISRLSSSIHSLRNPVDQFRNCQFNKNQPNPFHTEKRIIQNEKSDITLISRPALHGDHCTIGIIMGSGSRHGINMPSGKF
jgi:hypothetical protein